MIVEFLIMSIPLFVFLIYLYLRWNYDYWESRGIASLEGSAPFGNVKEIFFTRKTMGQFYAQIYREFPEEPLVGFYKMRQPILLIRHPDLVEAVLSKDFQSFNENDFHFDFNIDPVFTYNPFSLTGNLWKEARSVLTHALTPTKLDKMVPLLAEKCIEMVAYAEDNAMVPLESRALASNFTADVVARCIIGKKCNSFKNPSNEFRQMSNRIMSGELLPNLAVLLTCYAPSIGKLLKLRMIPKDVFDYFLNQIIESAKAREKEEAQHNDVLQELLNENAEAKAREEPPVHSNTAITGHCLNFYLDGFYTTSIVLGFCLYELARHPESQKKTREQIVKIEKNIADMNYSKLQDLSYLDLIIAETMRMHPPVPQMTKLCTCNTVLTHKGREYPITAGTPVAIPLYALHMDPQYYPNPEAFIPERFVEEEKANRHRFVYLPWGKGPRVCSGMPFATMQIKMALSALILNFEILLKDPEENFELDTKSSLLYLAKGGTWVKFKRLKQ